MLNKFKGQLHGKPKTTIHLNSVPKKTVKKTFGKHTKEARARNSGFQGHVTQCVRVSRHEMSLRKKGLNNNNETKKKVTSQFQIKHQGVFNNRENQLAYIHIVNAMSLSDLQWSTYSGIVRSTRKVTVRCDKGMICVTFCGRYMYKYVMCLGVTNVFRRLAKRSSLQAVYEVSLEIIKNIRVQLQTQHYRES